MTSQRASRGPVSDTPMTPMDLYLPRVSENGSPDLSCLMADIDDRLPAFEAA